MKIECFPANATGYSTANLTIDPRPSIRGMYDQYKNRSAAQGFTSLEVLTGQQYANQYSIVGMNGCCGAGFGFDPQRQIDNGHTKGILMYLNPDNALIDTLATQKNMEAVEIPVGEDRLVYLFAKEDK